MSVYEAFMIPDVTILSFQGEKNRPGEMGREHAGSTEAQASEGGYIDFRLDQSTYVDTLHTVGGTLGREATAPIMPDRY